MNWDWIAIGAINITLGIKRLFDRITRIAAQVGDTAALYLKWTLGLGIAWPLLLVVLSTFLPPKVAQVTIPIVALIPLVCLIAAILSMPRRIFAIGVATIGATRFLFSHQCKQLFTLLSAIIGTELMLGAFFAIVPLYNHREYVPLFVLASVALLFVRGRKIRWVIYALLLVLILGFYTKGFATEGGGNGTVSHAGYQPMVCQADERRDYSQSGLTEITLTLATGCHHGLITLPVWLEYTETIGPDQNAWVSVWCTGHKSPSGPLDWYQQGIDLGGIMTHCRNKGGYYDSFWIEGSGTITFREVIRRPTLRPGETRGVID